MSKGQRFADDFKKQIVRLYQSGKQTSVLSREHEFSIPSSLSKWIEQYGHSGLFKERESLTDEQRELKVVLCQYSGHVK